MECKLSMNRNIEQTDRGIRHFRENESDFWIAEKEVEIKYCDGIQMEQNNKIMCTKIMWVSEFIRKKY